MMCMFMAFGFGVAVGWVMFEKPEWMYAAINWVKSKVQK